MERDGLLHVAGDRQLALTDARRSLATRVMRKHRLAECLLVSVIQMPWEEVHIEACRWEHVISESVERRLYEMLGHPECCPHGNLIPGLDELPARVAGARRSTPHQTPTMVDVINHGQGARCGPRLPGSPSNSKAIWT